MLMTIDRGCEEFRGFLCVTYVCDVDDDASGEKVKKYSLGRSEIGSCMFIGISFSSEHLVLLGL